MSAHEHCPTKKDKHQARVHERLMQTAGAAASADPKKAWRSLDELADTPDFRDFLEREFPAGASELGSETTRRDFLKIMGASVALAGAATIPGCRRPDHKIMPYSAVVPEDVIPGKPMFYATSMPLPGGGAEGLLVETHDGRPTKVEGNPFHPINRGKSSVWAQAAILGIYDPDRLKYPLYRQNGQDRAASWEDFKGWAKEHFARFDNTRGQGLAVIADKKTSITREAMRQRFMQRYPDAVWVAYDATENAAAVRGTQLAFGSAMREHLTISANGQIAAKVIVSFDRNFLEQEDPANLVHQREFAATRRPLKAEDGMSRLYMVEPGFSLTGSCADHRLRMPPSRIPAVAVMLAKAVLERVGPQQSVAALAQAINAVQLPGEDLGGETAKFVSALADDLIAEDLHGTKHTRVGETLVLAGPTQPAEIHALCYALNQVLGNIGKTIRFTPMDPESASDSAAAIGELTRAMATGQIDTLVCIEANPLYNAPPGLNFAAAFEKVANTITLSCGNSETAAASRWALNGTHFLESWGDTVAWDGTVAPIQPMIAPLYGPSYSEIEFLAMLADPNAGISQSGGEPEPPQIPGAPVTTSPAQRVDDGYRILREAVANVTGQNVTSAEFDKAFKRALHDGIFRIEPPAPVTPTINAAGIGQALAQLRVGAAPTPQALDAFFFVGHQADGRFANNGWLMELPSPAPGWCGTTRRW